MVSHSQFVILKTCTDALKWINAIANEGFARILSHPLNRVNHIGGPRTIIMYYHMTTGTTISNVTVVDGHERMQLNFV